MSNEEINLHLLEISYEIVKSKKKYGKGEYEDLIKTFTFLRTLLFGY
jgi:hypothetical protein